MSLRKPSVFGIGEVLPTYSPPLTSLPRVSIKTPNNSLPMGCCAALTFTLSVLGLLPPTVLSSQATATTGGRGGSVPDMSSGPPGPWSGTEAGGPSVPLGPPITIVAPGAPPAGCSGIIAPPPPATTGSPPREATPLRAGSLSPEQELSAVSVPATVSTATTAEVFFMDDFSVRPMSAGPPSRRSCSRRLRGEQDGTGRVSTLGRSCRSAWESLARSRCTAGSRRHHEPVARQIQFASVAAVALRRKDESGGEN
jgi:hypothetical protein